MNNTINGTAKGQKTKRIVTIVVFAFVFLNTFFSGFASWINTAQSSVQEVYPELVSYSAQMVEQPTGYEEHDEDKNVIKVTFELTNNTNERMIISDGSYGYYYLDGDGYVQNLEKNDTGMILDRYDNAELIPSGETVLHSEYIAVPASATHVVFSRYSEDEEDHEFVIQF